MSSYSYYSVMPHCVAVTCPECAGEAAFEFAECVRIKTNDDLHWFEKSKHFDCLKEAASDGQYYHAAIYYHRLMGNTLPIISDLPRGYKIEDWAHSEHKFRPLSDWRGTLVCESCGKRSKHTLDWPREAYFQIEYRNQNLWAFDRASTAELIDYICASHRRADDFIYWPFLMKIPHVFLTRQARETVVKRLRKRLA
ncbi:MAG: hypothetical protein GYB42_06280 [Alphaproteobacteria bacterium]|nr:hypothetical protein [Alphaproteobacteria bacterium]